MIRLGTRYDKHIVIAHLVLWGFWAVSWFFYERNGENEDFRCFELVFMLGGWFLLLGLLSLVFNKYLVWAIIELLFIGIVAMHVKLCFSC